MIATFTLKAQGIKRVLNSSAGLSPANFLPEGSPVPPPLINNLNSIWDTGASGSVVNINTANKIGLQPISFMPVSTANGNFTAPVHICDIYLPSGVVIPGVTVTGGKLSADVDMLIGMDVISLGDFTITNLNGETWFTFRLPSIQRADFSKCLPKDNWVCTCGSGSMYKNCCKKLVNTGAFTKPK